MSKTRRGRLSSSSRVVPVFMLTLAMSLSLIITSSNTQQHVLAQQIAGVHQNNATKVIGKNNVSTTMLNPQQKPKLGGLAGSTSMMQNSTSTSQTSGNTTGAMMKAPQDVIIKQESNPIIPVGKQSQIKLLILDKTTQNPMVGAQVIVGIERGASMTTMDMIGPMFQAQEQSKGSGIYLVTFTPDFEGIYTLHTHVIPPGIPKHSMMDNHMDIGIVAQISK